MSDYIKGIKQNQLKLYIKMRYLLPAVCFLSICSIQLVHASKLSEEKKKDESITSGNNHRLVTLETIPKWVKQGQFKVKKYLGRSAYLVEGYGATSGLVSSQKEVTAKDKRAAVEKIRQLLREDLARVDRLRNHTRSADEPHTTKAKHENHRKSASHQRSKEKRGGKTKTTTYLTSTTTKRPKKKDGSHRTSSTTPNSIDIPTVRGLGDGFGRHT